jgi:hypothetical protein
LRRVFQVLQVPGRTEHMATKDTTPLHRNVCLHISTMPFLFSFGTAKFCRHKYYIFESPPIQTLRISNNSSTALIVYKILKM